MSRAPSTGASRRWRALAGVGVFCLLGALDCGARAVSVMRFDPHDGEEALVAPSFLELPVAPGGEAFTLRARFVPGPRAEILSLHFGLERDPATEDYDVLRLSTRPDVPSVLQRFSDGEVLTSIPVGSFGPDEAIDFELRVAPRRFSLLVHGDLLLDTREIRDPVPISLALHPNSPLGRFHVPLGALRRIEVESLAPDGSIRTLLDWRPWAAHPLRWPTLLLGAVLLVMALRRSRAVARVLGGCVLLSLVAPPIILMIILAASPLTREDRSDLAAEVSWTGANTVAGEDDALRVVALGGSVTQGYPDPQRIDPYPAQLARRLRSSPAFEGRPVEVTNLGRPTLRLWQIIDAWGPVLAREQPRVAILTSVFNNLEEGGNPRLILAQAFGFRRGVELARDATQIEAYAAGLRCFAALARANGMTTVWIEESVDPIYFDGRRVLAPLHEVLARVAREEEIDLVRFQEDIARDPEPLRFYEFIHPTSLGQRRIAEALETWFDEAAPELLAPRTPTDPVFPLDIEACRRPPLARGAGQ